MKNGSLTRMSVLVGLFSLIVGSSAFADTDGIVVHCATNLLVFIHPNMDLCDEPAHLGPGAVQAAVNHGEQEEVVLVGMGEQPEQVRIDKNVDLVGAGTEDTVFVLPAVTVTAPSLFSGAPILYHILVDFANGVAVTNLRVDGIARSGSCTPGRVGIWYRASSGEIQDTHVTKIDAGGCQTALGIFVQSGNKVNANVAIDRNIVDYYGKNGITANEPGTFVVVSRNTVTGQGGQALAAQNGVQIGFGARGNVYENTISYNFYVPPTPNLQDFVACGELFTQGGGITRGKTDVFVGNEQNVCNSAGGPSDNYPYNLYR